MDNQVLEVIKKRSSARAYSDEEFTKEQIEKVIVTDPEHVEIVWKFKDEVINFIGI